MDVVWKIALGACVGLLGVWLTLIAALLLVGRRYERPGLGDMLRLLPDLLRLLKRLADDKSLPRGVRVRLWLLLVYLAVPIDVIPDFIPVIGYADDAIIVALALRSVARHCGPQALHRHWPGSPAGLTAILRAAGIRNCTVMVMRCGGLPETRRRPAGSGGYVPRVRTWGLPGVRHGKGR